MVIALCLMCSSHSDIAGSDEVMFCVCDTFSRVVDMGQEITLLEILNGCLETCTIFYLFKFFCA